MLVCAHAATSGAEIFSSFCTIHDTLHDIQHVIVVVGAYAMSKPVFKVLRTGLLRYIFHTCPNL